VWTNPRHMPRAWIAEQVEVLPPLGRRDPAEPGRRTDLVLFPQGCPRDLRRSSVVETGAELPRAASTSGDRPPTDEGASSGTASADPPAPQWCRLLHYDPLRVEIEAHLARPGLVVLCDQFYLGWQLEIQTAGCASRRLPILRTNRVMRGAWLPAGRHLLCYRYRPGSFFWGALASGIGWFALGTLWIAATAGRCLRRRRRKPSRP